MAALGGLVHGVAHQLSTPIGNCITGSSCIEDLSNEMKQKFIERTISEKSLKKYLDNMATMSKNICISLLSAAKLINTFKQISLSEHTEEKTYFNIAEQVNNNVFTQALKAKYPFLITTLTLK